MSGKVKMNSSERLEVNFELNQPNPPNKQSIIQQYGVSEATIRKV